MERHQERLQRCVTQNSERLALTTILTGKHVFWVVQILIHGNSVKKLTYKIYIKMTYSSIFIEYQIYVTEESTAVVSATAKATGLNATTSGTYYLLCR